MRRFDFLVCYDISDKKRLRKVAKLLEKVSIRIQKSIFFYPEAGMGDIKTLSSNLFEQIDEKEDDVRIYRVDIKKSLNLSSAISLIKPNIIK